MYHRDGPALLDAACWARAAAAFFSWFGEEELNLVCVIVF